MYVCVSVCVSVRKEKNRKRKIMKESNEGAKIKGNEMKSLCYGMDGKTGKEEGRTGKRKWDIKGSKIIMER